MIKGERKICGMLTLFEKIIFILLLIVSIMLTLRGVRIMIGCINSAQGKVDWKNAWHSLAKAFINTISLKPTFQMRTMTSIFHAFVAWGFMFYLIVNIGDILQAFIPDFIFLGNGWVGNIYRLAADMMSAGVLLGMLYFIIRRFIVKPKEMQCRSTTLFSQEAKIGIQRDSSIVAAFIVLHVGARWWEQSLVLAQHREKVDLWQPLAQQISMLWQMLPIPTLIVLEHTAFWLAIGSILLFLPYFPHSKHIHIFFAPLNFLLKPQRRSMGELAPINFEDDKIEQFGATQLTDLGWEQIMDGYACIMCFRCQEVCPAYASGKSLSPAALEINKRYVLNSYGFQLAEGKCKEVKLTEYLISEEAVWECTACGACIQVCPVGNEPMRDILDIRRALVLMENRFPQSFQVVYRGLERSANPWGLPPEERCAWAKDIHIKTIEDNPHPKLLWWVGCAPAIDARAQKTAIAFAKLLNGVQADYAILGEQEACTGDAARRSGREDIFYELALRNIETLSEVAPQRIVTTCPHCFHVLKNEYAVYGGKYEVLHHTQLIHEWVREGKLKLKAPTDDGVVTYHDPCYLGRQNGVFDAAREILQHAAAKYAELPYSRALSFCCGAGGAQMWKEETPNTERVSWKRLEQTKQSGASVLMTACPFCLTMLSDAAQSQADSLQVVDIAEWIMFSTDDRPMQGET